MGVIEIRSIYLHLSLVLLRFIFFKAVMNSERLQSFNAAGIKAGLQT